MRVPPIAALSTVSVVAQHAEKANPGVMDQIGSFYAKNRGDREDARWRRARSRPWSHRQSKPSVME